MQTTTVYRRGNAFDAKVYTVKLRGLRGGDRNERPKTFAKTDIDLASYCSQDAVGNRDLTLELRWVLAEVYHLLARTCMPATGIELLFRI